MIDYAPTDQRVLTRTVVTLHRAFPSVGTLEVAPGDRVDWETVLGYYASRHRLRAVKVESSDGEIQATVLVSEGQKVKRGDVLAYYSYLFGLGYTEYTSPCDGQVVSVSNKVGAILIKEDPVPMRCHVPGLVESVNEATGVLVRSYGDFIECAAGAGYGRSGILVKKCDGPASSAGADSIGPSDQGKILVVGAVLGQDVIEAALKYRVAGLVAGSIPARVLRWYSQHLDSLTWDELQAQYWSREVKTPGEVPPPTELAPTVVITEGFGNIPMRQSVFDLLAARAEQRAYIDGSSAQGTECSRFSGRPCLFIPDVISPDAVLEWSSRSAGRIQAGSACVRRIEPGTLVQVHGFTSEFRAGVVTEVSCGQEKSTAGMSAPSLKVEAPGLGSQWIPIYNVVVSRSDIGEPAP